MCMLVLLSVAMSVRAEHVWSCALQMTVSLALWMVFLDPDPQGISLLRSALAWRYNPAATVRAVLVPLSEADSASGGPVGAALSSADIVTRLVGQAGSDLANFGQLGSSF